MLKVIVIAIAINALFYVGLLINGFKIVRSDDHARAHVDAYQQGLEEGGSFGKVVAYNKVIAEEIPRIISRYAQLQTKLINKPKKTMQDELKKFEEQEIERYKMEFER